MELIDLKADARQDSGKSAAKKLRNNNLVPGIMYGPDTEPILLAVPTGDLNKLVLAHGSSSVFVNLAIEGDNQDARTVLLKEVQKDTYGINYLHVDFQEIDMDKKISIFVPVEAAGTSPGVKEGGLLQIIRRELEVICLPSDVPDAIVIDISEMLIGDVIHVSEVDLGDDVEIPHEVDFTVLTIVPPTKAVEEEVEEEELEGEEAEEGEEEAEETAETASE